MKKFFAVLLAVLVLTGVSAVAENAQPDAVFSENGVTVNNNFLRAEGNTVYISNGGEYTFSGKADNASIVAAVPKGQEVTVRLAGVELSNDGPCLYINAKKAAVEVVEGTENLLKDASGRTVGDPAKTVVYATDDLTLCGKGSLTVESVLGHAVQCKDDLLICDLTLTVDSANDGLRGNDSVTVESGSLYIVCAGDGIQSSNESSGKGNVIIHGGIISIVSEKSPLQAVGSIQIDGGSLILTQDK